MYFELTNNYYYVEYIDKKMTISNEYSKKSVTLSKLDIFNFYTVIKGLYPGVEINSLVINKLIIKFKYSLSVNDVIISTTEETLKDLITIMDQSMNYISKFLVERDSETKNKLDN